MLMVRGDVTRLTLESGRKITLPERWGMIWDPIGELIPRCEILFAAYYPTIRERIVPTDEILAAAESYFGSTDDLVAGTAKIPCGPWIERGKVTLIEYERQGEKDGAWYHPFTDSAILFARRGGGAYRLVLGEGCVVNDRGFVKP